MWNEAFQAEVHYTRILIGDYTTEDVSDALDNFRRTAECDDARSRAFAQYHLWRMYHFGQGTQPDSAEAAQWGARAVRSLEPFASMWPDWNERENQYRLGEIYYHADGELHDRSKAMQLFAFAVWWEHPVALRIRNAEQGHSEAQFLLGLRYAHGYKGVPQDKVLAYKWFKLASANGGKETAMRANEALSTLQQSMSNNDIAKAEELAGGYNSKLG